MKTTATVIIYYAFCDTLKKLSKFWYEWHSARSVFVHCWKW